MTSQNIELSSWDILYINLFIHDLFGDAFNNSDYMERHKRTSMEQQHNNSNQQNYNIYGLYVGILT
jgi:hypothetical protein